MTDGPVPSAPISREPARITGRRKTFAVALLLGVLIRFVFPSNLFACSRVLWNDNGRAILVGQNMDLYGNPGTNIWVFPRGMDRNGLSGNNSLAWKSKYASIILPAFDIGTVAGFNESGLGVNMLGLSASDFGTRDETIPGVSTSLWGQFFLDNFATVSEAVQYINANPFQVLLLVTPDGHTGGVHMSLADANGDSAIVEYINGKPRVWHGKGWKVVTNDPTFDKQLDHMRQYAGFGGRRPLPDSNQSPGNRFVRAAWFLSVLPKPSTDMDAVAGVYEVLRKISVNPRGGNTSGWRTYWRAVADLTNRAMYFESTLDSHVIRVRLDHFDTKPGSPVMKLDLGNGNKRTGDVSGEFMESAPFEFRKAATPEELRKAKRF